MCTRRRRDQNICESFARDDATLCCKMRGLSTLGTVNMPQEGCPAFPRSVEMSHTSTQRDKEMGEGWDKEIREDVKAERCIRAACTTLIIYSAVPTAKLVPPLHLTSRHCKDDCYQHRSKVSVCRGMNAPVADDVGQFGGGNQNRGGLVISVDTEFDIKNVTMCGGFTEVLRPKRI